MRKPRAVGHCVFGVIVPEPNQRQAIEAAGNRPSPVGESNAGINLENGLFCDSASANSDILDEVKRQGYARVRLEECPAAEVSPSQN